MSFMALHCPHPPRPTHPAHSGLAEGPSFYYKGHVSGKWKQTSKITSHFALLTWPTLLCNANVCSQMRKNGNLFLCVVRWCLRPASKTLCERNLGVSGLFAEESVCSIDRRKSRRLENVIPLSQSAAQTSFFCRCYCIVADIISTGHLGAVSIFLGL